MLTATKLNIYNGGRSLEQGGPTVCLCCCTEAAELHPLHRGRLTETLPTLLEGQAFLGVGQGSLTVSAHGRELLICPTGSTVCLCVSSVLPYENTSTKPASVAGLCCGAGKTQTGNDESGGARMTNF